MQKYKIIVIGVLLANNTMGNSGEVYTAGEFGANAEKLAAEGFIAPVDSDESTDDGPATNMQFAKLDGFNPKTANADAVKAFIAKYEIPAEGNTKSELLVGVNEWLALETKTEE